MGLYSASQMASDKSSASAWYKTGKALLFVNTEGAVANKLLVDM